jgi:hypothetical protein
MTKNKSKKSTNLLKNKENVVLGNELRLASVYKSFALFANRSSLPNIP